MYADVIWNLEIRFWDKVYLKYITNNILKEIAVLEYKNAKNF